MEFGWPTSLEPVFGKPGVVVGASSGDWPAQMRALGAGTVYFDLNLKNRVGTPTKPTDPSTMADRAQRLYDFASQQTGCPTPVDRLQRARRARPRDAVVGHERAVPRERALVHPAASPRSARIRCC